MADEFANAMAEIRQRVAMAVANADPKGLKPFAQKNGMGETVVRDLVKSHNKDVQLSTLAKIAKGAQVPLVSLLPGQQAPVTPLALERALDEALQGPLPAAAKMPEYLAQTVLDILRLPAGLRDGHANDQTIDEDGTAATDDPR